MEGAAESLGLEPAEARLFGALRAPGVVDMGEVGSDAGIEQGIEERLGIGSSRIAQ